MDSIILTDDERSMLQEIYDKVDSEACNYNPNVYQVIWLADLVITRHGMARITPNGLKELLFHSNPCITIGNDCMKSEKFIDKYL
jgi:hypothetical protein